jgi:hypothetical protein
VVVRNSDGSWHTVLSDGSPTPFHTSDEDFEHWAQANQYTVHKAQFGAPKAAPAPVSTGPKAQLSGWQNLSGLPNPEAFSYLSDPTQGMNAKAGDYVFVQSGSIGATGGGIVAQLKEDWDGSGTFTATRSRPWTPGASSARRRPGSTRPRASPSLSGTTRTATTSRRS